MTPPGELVIARHGEAWCNVHQVVGGPRGCRGLTETGRMQVHQLAYRLRHEDRSRPFDALYTTPLRRARESADLVAEALNIDATVEANLRETDYGDADGMSWTEAVAAFDGVPSREPDRPIARGAESWTAYLRRSMATLRAILCRHTGQRVLIVGHGESVVTAAHLFLELPANVRSKVDFAAYPASLTIWQQQPVSWTRTDAGWRWTLLRQNDVSHTEAGCYL